MKRAVESNVAPNHPRADIVVLGSAMSSFALVSDPKPGLYEPEQLKNVEIGVNLFNGSDFTMHKMMEGVLKREEIKWTNCRTHKECLEALRRGKLKASAFKSPGSASLKG